METFIFLFALIAAVATAKYEYKFVTQKVNWYAARDACKKWSGGYLAIIRSKAENDYLTQQLKNRKILSSWIGLTDVKKEGKFVWNKNGEVPTFKNWAKGQPNNWRNQDCTELLTKNQYRGKLGDSTWSDLSCSISKRSYICQKMKQAAGVKCNIVNGNGVGGTRVKVGNQRGEDCIQACYQKSRTDREINGATWYYTSNRAGCWCSKKMVDTNKQVSFKTCFLFGPPPKPAPMECSFTTGEGTGGTKLKIGRYLEKDCIANCLKRSVFDKSINGVTMNKDATIKGCWCQKNMKGQNTNKRYRTCRFATSPSTKYQYKFEKKEVNWYDAAAACTNWGGYLLVIRSKDENDFITKELKKRNMVATWTALNDKQKEGTFVWNKKGETSSFRNWAKGQPNNYGNQDCVELVAGSKHNGAVKDGKWSDMNCYGSKISYVCEKKKN